MAVWLHYFLAGNVFLHKTTGSSSFWSCSESKRTDTFVRLSPMQYESRQAEAEEGSSSDGRMQRTVPS